MNVPLFENGGDGMFDLDNLDSLYVIWAYTVQIVFIIHFAIRKRFFERYTMKYGWLVYALSIPAAMVSVILLIGGKTWSIWLGGFLFLIYGAYGYRIDYVKKVQWRKPLQLSIMVPYVFLYLGTIMFYWWPLGLLSRTLWYVFAVLFLIGTILNISSH
jgi:hypothetical protein